MIASMMMYARPELAGAHDRYWELIRGELEKRGIKSPQKLAQDAEEFTVWGDPDLVLSQTCGMPYRLRLHETVQLVGTPDFGLADCPPGYYRSAFVVRDDDPRNDLAAYRDARFAYNMIISQSGWSAPYTHLRDSGFWFHERVQSHGHANSARMVAKGEADIASLDAKTWAIVQEYERFADSLRVLEWTAPTPGLPYIAGPNADPDATFDAVAAAIAGLSSQDRDALGLRGIVRIPSEHYLAIANPPDAAAS